MFLYQGPYQDTYHHCYDAWSERFIRFFTKYPVHPFTKKAWDWRLLSANKNVTWKTIQNHPEFPWNFEYASVNQNVTWNIIEENREKGWDLTWMGRNPNITLDIVEKLERDDYPWITSSPCAYSEFYYYLSCSPAVSLDFVMSRQDKRWNWSELAKHLPYDTPQIQQNPYLMSRSKYLVWDHVINGSHQMKDWDWEELSMHPNITPEIIEAHPDLSWDWYAVWFNPNITWTFLSNHYKVHPSNTLSHHSCVTLSHLQNFPDVFPSQHRFYQFYSNNPNLTLNCAEELFSKSIDIHPDRRAFEFERNECIERMMTMYHMLYLQGYIKQNDLKSADIAYQRSKSLMIWMNCVDLLRVLAQYIQP